MVYRLPIAGLLVTGRWLMGWVAGLAGLTGWSGLVGWLAGLTGRAVGWVSQSLLQYDDATVQGQRPQE